MEITDGFTESSLSFLIMIVAFFSATFNIIFTMLFSLDFPIDSWWWRHLQSIYYDCILFDQVDHKRWVYEISLTYFHCLCYIIANSDETNQHDDYYLQPYLPC